MRTAVISSGIVIIIGTVVKISGCCRFSFCPVGSEYVA